MGVCVWGGGGGVGGGGGGSGFFVGKGVGGSVNQNNDINRFRNNVW